MLDTVITTAPGGLPLEINLRPKAVSGNKTGVYRY